MDGLVGLGLLAFVLAMLVSSIRLGRPEDAIFLKVRVGWVRGDSMTLRLPFDRYYMDEFEAPVSGNP